MPAASRTSLSVALPVAGLVLGIVAFATLFFDYRDYWLDDAFITFRYARHLASGVGPVFNPGEAVEGYTSFAWMVLTAIPAIFAGDTAVLGFYKAFAFAASLWVLYRVWQFPGPDGRVRRYGVLLLATQPIFVLNAGDGMESALFMLLLVETCLALQRAPRLRSGVVAGGLTAVMVLTRPESLPLLVVIPALVAFVHRGAAGQVRGFLRGFAFAGGAPVLAHAAWRVAYYGAWLPNTFHAKATGDPMARLASGLDDLGRFVFANPWQWPVGLWVMSALALVATWHLVPRTQPRAMRFWTALWLMIGFRVAFDLWSGSDTMGRHRFLAPLIVPLAILADEGARHLWRGFGRGVVVASFAIAIGFNLAGHRVHAGTIAWYVEGLERAHVQLGQWLGERHPSSAWLAIADAGAVPYFSGLPTVDLWGLNDATIARLPGEFGHKLGMPAYVFDRDPDVIVLWNQRPFFDGRRGRVLGGQAIDHAIASHPAFGERYRFVREFVFRERAPDIPGYYLDVFERRAAPLSKFEFEPEVVE